jgi:ADP-ribosyl-[dinitrogen reductase] hydrolase
MSAEGRIGVQPCGRSVKVQVTEDIFLGAMLGSAIGDALGAPLAGKHTEEIGREFGTIDGYLPTTLPDGLQIEAGEITEETEINLCILESVTTNDGFVIPENISARLIRLVEGPSRHWMTPTTVVGIEEAYEHDGLVPETDDGTVDLSVSLRGVPAGLLHALGAYDPASIDADANHLARLSHGDEVNGNLTAAVARAIRTLAIAPADDTSWRKDIEQLRQLEGGEPVRVALDAVSEAAVFEEPVFATVARGGAADTNGALAGAFAGARFGASGIPQRLIDGLGARIYISLAVTWFYRTALRRAGTVIDLREL